MSPVVTAGFPCVRVSLFQPFGGKAHPYKGMLYDIVIKQWRTNIRLPHLGSELTPNQTTRDTSRPTSSGVYPSVYLGTPGRFAFLRGFEVYYWWHFLALYKY